MEKICIIYDSKHNMNTEKLVLSLKVTYNNVDIIKVNNFDMSTINNYQKIGLASGIYWGKFSKNIEDLLNKICLGIFSCKGFDNYGSFKLIGGINKGKPNEDDTQNLIKFLKNIY